MKYLKQIIFLSLIFAVATPLYAAGISVAPTVNERILESGEVHKGVYTVRNDADIPLVITVQPENWLSRVYGEDIDDDVNEWISLESTEFELGPKEKRDIAYTMKAPLKFTRERVAQLFFEYKDPTKKAQFRTRLGVIVYMSPKNGKLKGRFTDFHVNYQEIQEGDKTEYFFVSSYKMENLGEVHLRPSGDVTIWNSRTNEMVGHIRFKPTKGIYPSYEDDFTAREVAEKMPPGNYVAEARIDIGQLYRRDKILKKKYYFKID